MKSKENLLSAWAVLIGVIFAIILGVFQGLMLPNSKLIYAILAILGVIIGLASATEEQSDATTFLLATISLVIVSYMGQSALSLIENIGKITTTILNALLIMFIPATVIVALKTVFSIASFK
ncbi:MAG: hypothetical protein QXJ28_01770 [Candidatus Pacearchaeota archaeon]